MKTLLVFAILFIASGSYAQNWVNATKSSSSQQSGFRFLLNGVGQFYIYTNNNSNDLNIKSAVVSGESDALPRIQFPYTSPNIYMGLSGGNVGIGTFTPNNKLDVSGIIGVHGKAVINTGNSPDGNDIYINSRVIRNESEIQTDGMYVNYASNGGAGAHLRLYANGTIERLRIDAGTGNVGIGTTNPSSKLAVNGNIHAKEVKVDLTGWPDYVFAKDYRLQPLKEVKDYIEQNQHLPEMPSATEVEANGVMLGEMNKLLLKKVEELTLHLIRQQEEIEALKQAINN